ncbi:MAG: type II secretion system F family protein, partial [Candidatus Thorarchaeota archaeon]
RLCRFSERIAGRSSRKRDDKELQKAVKFLVPLMDISVRGVSAAANLMSVLILLLLFFILALFELSLLIIVPLAGMAAVLTYYIVISYPVTIMNGYKLGLSEEADLVFEQFILVFQSGGTIFDAIEMVAQSDHPYLSKAFTQMIGQINDGVPPETCLMDFAKDQPSDDLRRYITAIVSSLEKKTDLLDSLSGESFEADLALRQKNLELESRLLIVAALVTYVPIMFTLAASLAGFATSILVVLVAPIFVLMNMLLKNRFARQFSSYFDHPRENLFFAPTQKQIISEYDAFLNFLILLGERLRSGDTLEVSLASIRDDLDIEVQILVDIALRAIHNTGASIAEAMALASEESLGQRVHQMLNMIVAMCETSAQAAGDRISRIATRLVKRSAVAKERDSIIAAQRMKVYLLTITSAAVLGMLASLSPFLFIGSLLSQGPLWTPGSITTMDILPLLVTLTITTLSTGYQNTRMVGGSRSVTIGVICGLLFLTSFSISSSMMGL